ncbi:hypothetical protein [Polyangium fumosum]|uniref:Uncharacterized protein n=1 Tax=Polyangium fumosum TaxID=889272 RepID=A0A4U1JFJ5_9BACT|nr:hypothetical protein [Polyangium fumosum]TKD10041.1 hypothetical protein E8A74_10600 [Polyangium fumosum]
MRSSGAKLFTASVVALATPAMADDTLVDPRLAFRLAYVVPADVRCPTEAALAELTSAKFRYDVFPESARASLSVTVRRAGGQLEAVLTARDEQGTLQWEETATPRRTCNDLVEDVALMVAARFVTVKGETPEAWTLLAPPAPTSPAPVPVPERQPPDSPLVPTPPPQPAPSAGAAAATSFHPELSAAAVFGPLDTPNVALGGALQIALRWPGASLGAELRGVVDYRGEVAEVPVRTWFATGVVLPCLVIHNHGRACIPISAGIYQISVGAAAKMGSSFAVPFGGAGLRGSYDVALSAQVRLRGYAEVLIAVTRADLVYVPPGQREAERIWAMPAMLSSIGVGAIWEP